MGKITGENTKAKTINTSKIKMKEIVTFLMANFF